MARQLSGKEPLPPMTTTVYRVAGRCRSAVGAQDPSGRRRHPSSDAMDRGLGYGGCAVVIAVLR